MAYFKGRLSEGKARISLGVRAAEEQVPLALGVLAFIGSSSSMVERLTVAQETQVRFLPSALKSNIWLRQYLKRKVKLRKPRFSSVRFLPSALSARRRESPSQRGVLSKRKSEIDLIFYRESQIPPKTLSSWALPRFKSLRKNLEVLKKFKQEKIRDNTLPHYNDLQTQQIIKTPSSLEESR